MNEQACVYVMGGDGGGDYSGRTLWMCGKPGHDGVHDDSSYDIDHAFTAAPNSLRLDTGQWEAIVAGRSVTLTDPPLIIEPPEYEGSR